jgi:hypothetical protein
MRNLKLHIKKLLYTSFLLSLIGLSVMTSPVSAIDTNDLDAILRKHAYYEPQTCTVDTSTQLSGSDNVEIAFRFLISKGLTSVQSAGFVGNLIAESGVNPAAQERNPTSGRGGFGIAQWTGGRRIALENAAQEQGVDVADLAFQLNFLWGELEGAYKNRVLIPLQATTTLEAATDLVLRKFEAPAVINLAPRLEFAESVLSTYGGADSVTPSSIGASQGCSSIIGSGQDTQFIDGFTVYSQTDPDWKDLPYGSSTIGLSGCGPAAMAMIITALTGRSVLPPDTANYAASQGLYIPEEGSSWSIAPVLAKQWGLKATPLGADLGNISATLQSGGLVIVAGQGAKPFTSAGHFIVIRGLTADGKFKIGDSGHSDTSNQDWDPQQIMASIGDRGGSVYGISR